MPAPTLADALAELLSPRLGVQINPAMWTDKLFPDHLRVRVEVVDSQAKVLGASRDLGELQAFSIRVSEMLVSKLPGLIMRRGGRREHSGKGKR